MSAHALLKECNCFHREYKNHWSTESSTWSRILEAPQHIPNIDGLFLPSPLVHQSFCILTPPPTTFRFVPLTIAVQWSKGTELENHQPEHWPGESVLLFHRQFSFFNDYCTFRVNGGRGAHSANKPLYPLYVFSDWGQYVACLHFWVSGNSNGELNYQW